MRNEQKRDDLDYNFVFFFARDDFWHSILGKELYENDHVKVYKETFDGTPLMQKLFHYHWSYRINRKIRLPLKKIWFKRMYGQSFDNDLPLCFVYLGGNNIYADGGFTDYVRRRDPRNRQIIMHEDLIKKKCDYDYSIVRNKVDLATTYDKSEAEEYNIDYFREDTYSMPLPLPEHIDHESDVFFLGAAKDRLHDILDTHRVLSGMGLKCKFMIAGVEPEDQVAGDGIEYTKGISYKENIEHVIKTRCVLELIQKGSEDITTRALEAIAYRKKLLTNCQTIPREFFNEGQLHVFDAAESIDPDFFCDIDSHPDYVPRYDMDPLRRLYFFQEQLEKINE